MGTTDAFITTATMAAVTNCSTGVRPCRIDFGVFEALRDAKWMLKDNNDQKKTNLRKQRMLQR
jgi:hypothetical protein